MSDQTALTLPQRAAAALGSAAHEKELVELAKKHTGIVAITNDDGLKDCHSARMELKNRRLAIEKAGKAAREDAQLFAKACIGEQNRLIGIILPEETRLQALQDAWEAKVEAEKQAKALAEQQRVATIGGRILDLELLPSRLVGEPIADLAAAIEKVADDEPSGWAQEFLERASAARDKALGTMRGMHAAAVAAAAEALRQAEERARIEAEQKKIAEARAAFEAEQNAAKEKAEAEERERRRRAEDEERAARERREAADREAQAARDEADRKAAEARREQEARAQAELERAAALRREQEEKAHQAKLAAEREAEEKARKQREEDEARERAARQAEEARQEAERARQRAEQEAKDEAERKERLRLAAIEDGRSLLRNFCEEYGSLPEFQEISVKVKAFLDGKPDLSVAAVCAAIARNELQHS